MYNKVLEIKPDNEAARGALNSCIAEMNAEYIKMKSMKRDIRVSESKKEQKSSHMCLAGCR